jgi:hypothetical protein
MTFGRRIASLFLISLVFVTTLCAQACFDPVPDSKCPMHQTSDCCKHEDSNAGRVTLATLNQHRMTRVVIAWPAQVAHQSSTDLIGFQFATSLETELHPPALSRPLIPSSVPLALRI